jgi:lipopolysaccharide export system ATP-binding protein
VLLRLRERGVGVLLTDHNVRETLVLCDRTYVLSDGVVLAEGRTSELVKNPEVRKRFLGDSFDEIGFFVTNATLARGEPANAR